MRYHKVFRHFHPRTIEAVKRLRHGWSSLSDEQKWERMDEFLWQASDVYGMDIPLLSQSDDCGDGCYHGDSNSMWLPKPSIITLLHEFRHAMQTQGKATSFYRPHTHAEDVRGGYEVDARAWSLSLYFTVAPNTLRRLVRNGQVFHITEQDLTSV